MMPRSRYSLCLAAAALAYPVLLCGCVTAPGDPFAYTALPAGAPSAGEVLADLAEADGTIAGFQATGKFILKTPELDTVYLLPSSSISFRRPADLHVTGRKYAATVLRLTCVGKRFLIELPTEKEFYHNTQGEAFESMDRRVSPAEVVREMFLPEDWSSISPDHARVVEYNANRSEATLVLYTKGSRPVPYRRLVVRGVPWVVVESTLLGEKGGAIAQTRKSEYHELDGARFPTLVETVFPGESAEMRFDMRRFEINVPSDDALFDMDARLTELNRRGHQQVVPVYPDRGES